MLDSITPVILTYNEEANIERTLSCLGWARDIVVVDSGSSDATRGIVATFPRARVFERPFDSHASQWNFAIGETGISTEWILALDADYIVTAALTEELSTLAPNAQIDGYAVDFKYCIAGVPLRGALYPRNVVLFRKGCGRYVQSGHTQRLNLTGAATVLRNRMLHDDRKPLGRWLSSQQKYARLEAEYLLSLPKAELRIVDVVRLTGWLAPFLVFFYTFFAKRCILDGRAGRFYVLQRTLAEIMIALEVLERRFQNASAAR